jgi:uncharacterized protein (DUF849 family)
MAQRAVDAADCGLAQHSAALSQSKAFCIRIKIERRRRCIESHCGLGAFLFPDPDDESRALPESEVLPVAALDITSGNQVEGDIEFVYLNTTRTFRRMAKRFQEINIKPELEYLAPAISGLERLSSPKARSAARLSSRWFSMRFGSARNRQNDPLPKIANASGRSMGRHWHWPTTDAQAALLGGVRVVEDNLYLSRGIFATKDNLSRGPPKSSQVLA